MLFSKSLITRQSDVRQYGRLSQRQLGFTALFCIILPSRNFKKRSIRLKFSELMVLNVMCDFFETRCMISSLSTESHFTWQLDLDVEHFRK